MKRASQRGQEPLDTEGKDVNLRKPLLSSAVQTVTSLCVIVICKV
jgi:hypothetical protein